MTKQTMGWCIAEKRRGRSLTRGSLVEPEEHKPLSRLVCPNGDVMQFNQPMELVKRDMEERDDAGIFRMMNREDERVFDMRHVLRLIDGGVAGQLCPVWEQPPQTEKIIRPIQLLAAGRLEIKG